MFEKPFVTKLPSRAVVWKSLTDTIQPRCCWHLAVLKAKNTRRKG